MRYLYRYRWFKKKIWSEIFWKDIKLTDSIFFQTDSFSFFHLLRNIRPVVMQGHKCLTVNATVCGFDLHSRKNYLFNSFISSLNSAHCLDTTSRQKAELSFVTQHAKFSLPTLLYAGYSVKLYRSTISIQKNVQCGIQREATTRFSQILF